MLKDLLQEVVNHENLNELILNFVRYQDKALKFYEGPFQHMRGKKIKEGEKRLVEFERDLEQLKKEIINLAEEHKKYYSEVISEFRSWDWRHAELNPMLTVKSTLIKKITPYYRK